MGPPVLLLTSSLSLVPSHGLPADPLSSVVSAKGTGQGTIHAAGALPRWLSLLGAVGHVQRL